MPVKFWQTIVRFWFFLWYLITTVMNEYFRILAKFCQNSRRHSDCNFRWNSSKNQMSLELWKNSAANCSSDEIPTRKVRRFGYKRKYCLHSIFNFSTFPVRILSLEQTASEFRSEWSKKAAGFACLMPFFQLVFVLSQTFCRAHPLIDCSKCT